MKPLYPRLSVWVLLVLGTGCGSGNPVSPVNTLPAAFSVTGTTALMSGLIVEGTPSVLNALIAAHPEVDTIVMINVVGSLDTEATFIAGRMLRQHGLNTHVPTNGVIASGGTDLFISGVIRTVESGAQTGSIPGKQMVRMASPSSGGICPPITHSTSSSSPITTRWVSPTTFTVTPSARPAQKASTG